MLEISRTGIYPGNIVSRRVAQTDVDKGGRRTDIQINLSHVNLTFRHSLRPTGDLEERIDRIAGFINDLEKLSKISPKIKMVLLTDIPGTGIRMGSTDDCVILDIWDPDYLDTIAHEGAHGIFKQIEDCSLDWRLIYYFSLGGTKRYDIVKESTFYPKDYALSRERSGLIAGHPQDSAHELFASSFTAFVNHSDALIARIQSPQTPKGTALVGKIIYLYIRDRMFSGNTFSAQDVFRDEKLEDLLGNISANEVADSLDKLNTDDFPCDLLAMTRWDERDRTAVWLRRFGRQNIWQIYCSSNMATPPFMRFT